MNMIILVQTDALFHFALQAMGQLNGNQLVNLIGSKTVFNNFVCNQNNLDSFPKRYDWARTTAVTARAFLIKALNLDRDANMKFPETTTTRQNFHNGLQEIVFPPGSNFPNLAINVQEAKTICKFYDQMFPHYMLESSGTPFARHCLIFFHTGASWTMYHVSTTISFNSLTAPVYSTTVTVFIVGVRVSSDAEEKSPFWKNLKQLFTINIMLPDDLLNSFKTLEIEEKKKIKEKKNSNEN